jgi:hypothetical protein
LALKKTIFQKYGPRADLGWLWLTLMKLNGKLTSSLPLNVPQGFIKKHGRLGFLGQQQSFRCSLKFNVQEQLLLAQFFKALQANLEVKK